MGGRIWVPDSRRGSCDLLFTVPAAGEELHSRNGDGSGTPAEAHEHTGDDGLERLRSLFDGCRVSALSRSMSSGEGQDG